MQINVYLFLLSKFFVNVFQEFHIPFVLRVYKIFLKIYSENLFLIFPYVILLIMGNENKQMWFATFNPQLVL